MVGLQLGDTTKTCPQTPGFGADSESWSLNALPLQHHSGARSCRTLRAGGKKVSKWLHLQDVYSILQCIALHSALCRTARSDVPLDVWMSGCLHPVHRSGERATKPHLSDLDALVFASSPRLVHWLWINFRRMSPTSWSLLALVGEFCHSG
jgi:hypothetical protein